MASWILECRNCGLPFQHVILGNEKGSSRDCKPRSWCANTPTAVPEAEIRILLITIHSRCPTAGHAPPEISHGHPADESADKKNRVTLFRILNHTNDSLGFIFV